MGHTNGNDLSNPSLARGTTIHLMLPRTEQLRMENVRPSAVQLDAPQRTLALRQKFNARRALQITAQHSVVHGLSVEPGETITAGLVLDSGPKVLPGTATRVTILARYGDTVLGGSTYILRIPAKPRATRVAALNPKLKVIK